MVKCKPQSVSLFWAIYEDSVLQDEADSVVIFIYSVQLTFGTLGLILNIFFMALILNHKELRYDMSSYLTLFLAVSDIMICGGIIMTDSALFLAYYYAREVVRPSLMTCQLWTSFNTLACCSSTLHVPAIALNRYMMISRPLHYTDIMDMKKMAILQGSVWLISVCIAMVPFKLSFQKLCSNSETIVVDSHTPSNHSAEPIVFIKLTQGKHLHPLRLCDLVVGPVEGILVVSVAVLLPAVFLVALCCMIYNVTYMHKKSLSYKIVLGRVLSLRHCGKPDAPPPNIDIGLDTRKNTGLHDEVRHTLQVPSAQESDANARVSTSSAIDNKNAESVRVSSRSLETKSIHLQTLILPVKDTPFGVKESEANDSVSSSVKSLRTTNDSVASSVTSVRTIKENIYRAQEYVVGKLRDSFSLQDKAFRILALLMGTYLLAWVPVALTTIIDSLWPFDFADYKHLSQRLLNAAHYTACVNPIIYGLSDKRILTAFKGCFKPARRRTQAFLMPPEVSVQHVSPGPHIALTETVTGVSHKK